MKAAARELHCGRAARVEGSAMRRWQRRDMQQECGNEAGNKEVLMTTLRHSVVKLCNLMHTDFLQSISLR